MGVSPKQREPANLIDGDTATKWLDENLRDASWLGRTTDPPASAIHSILRFELAQPTQVRATPHPHPHPQPQPHPHPHPHPDQVLSYELFTANDQIQRDPVSWEVGYWTKGANGGNFLPVSTVTD